MAVIDLQRAWAAFPTHEDYPTLADLYGALGGRLARNIASPGFGATGNTCATRMSRALNYGGAPIEPVEADRLGLKRLTGDDGMSYLFRVAELRTYLSATMSCAPETVRSGFTIAFAGQPGIVAFKVKGWSDASGHVALWDGVSFREDHDDYRTLQDDPDTVFIEAHVESMTLWPC